ncbi:hypothetical protein RchiOBHm_Chr5g0048391 [Rosa chinensis]|uniref:Uncharacterized protein n=1 Tax=Rosa chinensis TaxID=74649 RepID=A0A2P6QEM8_ROSCH|nr:hypothetical protein RchiOBHm_Chr5g0048391 [Rosa chinensis]
MPKNQKLHHYQVWVKVGSHKSRLVIIALEQFVACSCYSFSSLCSSLNYVF